MTDRRPKKPFALPVLNPEAAEDWLESDEAVPHPDASADPEVERQFLHSFAREARPAKQCCEEMETQLGFSRTQPVVLHDGRNYWLPSPSGDPGVLPAIGATISFCPWCGKNLDRAAHPPRPRPQHQQKKPNFRGRDRR